jgi:hypothetical protein
MNLHKQRTAVMSELAKAKRHHRSTAELQRKLQIITAGILAQEIEQERERNRKTIPAELLKPCSEADPALWALFCETQNRPSDPSQVWTVMDVMMLLTHKAVEWTLAGDPPSRLSH